MAVGNYRPISCLPSASKVLEGVVERQLRQYFEENQLLPQGQHGFRKGRSMTSALASMVSEWAMNYEDGKHSGALMWDLSAAFDTIDTDILCNKLSLYGLSG